MRRIGEPMAIACVDWRTADHGALAVLYADEIGRWSVALGWETAASWDHIELGRRLGTVPGLLAIDASGAIVGWTFYLLHHEVLQIGGFAALSELATTALLDGIFASEAAARAQSVTVFVFSDAPGLSSALTRRGLTVAAYDYLMKPLPGDAERSVADRTPSPVHPIEPPGALRRWRPGDGPAVAALLGSAYPGANGVRPFAPRGTVDEWQEYFHQLVAEAGCGTIMPDGCYVVPAGLDRVSGVVLVTRLGDVTAHIAQLAVDPCAQRVGLGRLLVSAACASAADAGCARITLLVEGRNVRARRLYEAFGFGAVARFVSAGNGQPRRLTSVAVGGGATTRP